MEKFEELKHRIRWTVHERDRIYDDTLKENYRRECLSSLGRFIVLALGLGIVFFVLFLSR